MGTFNNPIDPPVIQQEVVNQVDMTDVVRRLMSPVSVSLKGGGTYDLYTVPDNKILFITNLFFRTSEAIAGTLRDARIKIGTPSGSYNEVLGSSGQLFTGSNLATLLGLNKLIDALSNTVSSAPERIFPGGTQLRANVSNTLGASAYLTTGVVDVVMFGSLY